LAFFLGGSMEEVVAAAVLLIAAVAAITAVAVMGAGFPFALLMAGKNLEDTMVLVAANPSLHIDWWSLSALAVLKFIWQVGQLPSVPVGSLNSVLVGSLNSVLVGSLNSVPVEHVLLFWVE